MKKENLNLTNNEDMLDSSIFDVEMEIPDASTLYNDKKKKTSKDLSINEAADVFLKNPNEKTFGVLWERSWWGLRQKIHEIIQDNDMVEEIAITTLQKVWEKREQFNPEVAKFSTWMYRICINEALGYKLRKHRDNIVDNDISDLYAKTLFKGEGSETFDDDSYRYSDKFERGNDGDIRLIGYEDIITNMVDASVNILQEMKDPRVKICMIEKNRSVFWPIIENNPKYEYLKKLIKTDDTWNSDKNANMKLEEISDKYDYPLTSVKNWIHKGKMDLGKIMKEKYPDLYDMWKDVA